MASATTTAMGTIATGAANSSGTNASWVATVNPNGVSKRTLVAGTVTTVQKMTGAAAKPCGGLSHHSTATAATKPAPTIPSASSYPFGHAGTRPPESVREQLLFLEAGLQ